jgi:hypothetical protein
VWCVDFHYEGGIYRVNGTSTDLERAVWLQVVAGGPCHVTGRLGRAASTDFLHQLGLLLLVLTRGNQGLGQGVGPAAQVPQH